MLSKSHIQIKSKRIRASLGIKDSLDWRCIVQDRGRYQVSTKKLVSNTKQILLIPDKISSNWDDPLALERHEVREIRLVLHKIEGFRLIEGTFLKGYLGLYAALLHDMIIQLLLSKFLVVLFLPFLCGKGTPRPNNNSNNITISLNCCLLKEGQFRTTFTQAGNEQAII